MICNNLKRYVSCMLYVCSSSSVVLIVPGHAREIVNRLENTNSVGCLGGWDLFRGPHFYKIWKNNLPFSGITGF